MDRFEEYSKRIISDLIKDLKCVDWQAAGVVGNFAAETGKFKIYQEISPTVKGSKGGYGWAQWTGPRRRSFEAWCHENHLHVDSYEGNYGFLVHELKGTENKALKALYKTNTANEAAKVFMEKYERPGIPALDKRIKYANEALKIYREGKTVITPTVEDQPYLVQYLIKLIAWVSRLFTKEKK